MKDNYIGNILLAFAIGTLIFFAGAQACQNYPMLAKWMGGTCWFETIEIEWQTSSAILSHSVSQENERRFLEAKVTEHTSSDDEIVKAAIHALAQSGSKEAITTLKQIARSHESVSIRKTALHALGRCASSEELIPFYQSLAEEDHVLVISKSAIHAIGQLGSDEAVNVLVDIATGLHHVSLRKAAVHALQNSDADSAQKALYRILAQVTG